MVRKYMFTYVLHIHLYIFFNAFYCIAFAAKARTFLFVSVVV